ncbi:MAG: hypothetical protein DRP35_09420, partial [Candidatus Zixiibacteriota bacterium]
MVKFKRIIHQKENRIAIIFPFDNKIANQVKSIEGRRWSTTKKVWHVPDNKETIAKLKVLFPESFTKKEKTKPLPQKRKVNNLGKVYVFISRQHIIIQLNKKDEDIYFLKTLTKCHWDNNNKRWIVSNDEETRKNLKQYFGDRIIITDNLPKVLNNPHPVKTKELHVFEHVPGRIKLIFKYDKAMKDLIKSLPYSRWDEKNNWWTTVYAKDVIKMLKQFCSENKWKIKFFKKEISLKKKRIDTDDVPNYRKCPQEYIDSLRIKRYSENTIRTYSNLFEEFINYYYSKKPFDITEKEIIAYIRYLVIERKISISYQNQAINAIKYYYEKMLGENRKFYFVERPRTEKVLPEVLSKEEVGQMISVTDNLKHKCLIMLTYSGGLRLGEVKNLKIKDIDFERNIINIRKGKGKKDRITLLSKKIIGYLQ